VGIGELHTPCGKTIDIRSFDSRFAITGEMRRHIVGNDPDDIGSIIGVGYRPDKEKTKRKDTLHGKGFVF
jgi:hypothetical protein